MPSVGHSTGASAARPASAEGTGGSGAYATTTCSAASSACARDSATTSTTGSPTKRTVSSASARWSGVSSSGNAGARSSGSSGSRSAAPSTATTPGSGTGRVELEPRHKRVRMRAPDEHRVELARNRHVGGEHRLAPEQAWVLDPQDPRAGEPAGAHASSGSGCTAKRSSVQSPWSTKRGSTRAPMRARVGRLHPAEHADTRIEVDGRDRVRNVVTHRRGEGTVDPHERVDGPLARDLDVVAARRPAVGARPEPTEPAPSTGPAPLHHDHAATQARPVRLVVEIELRTGPTFAEPTFAEPTFTEPTFAEPTFTEPAFGPAHRPSNRGMRFSANAWRPSGASWT